MSIFKDGCTLSSRSDGCLTDEAIIAIIPEPPDEGLPLLRTTQHFKCLEMFIVCIDLNESSAVGVRFNT